MRDEALQQLMDRADESAPPLMIGDIVDAVHRRITRQRRSQRIAAAALLLALSLLVLHQLSRSRGTPSATVDTAGLRREVAQLQAAADVHRQVALALRKAQKIHLAQLQSEWELENSAALDPLGQARSRAAMILIRDAQRMQSEPGQANEAQHLYQTAAELLPQSGAGRDSRARSPSGV